MKCIMLFAKIVTIWILTVFLLACGLSTRHNDTITSNNETQFKSQSELIYLKPFNEYHYPPGSGSEKAKLHTRLYDYGRLKFQTFKLKNGLQVYILPRRNLPVVNITAVVEAGKHFSSLDDERWSPLVLKLLKQGTEQFSKTDFQYQQARLGELMRYGQTDQLSTLSVAVLPQDVKLALNLIAQQLVHIKPADNALKKIIEQQLLENKLSQTSGFYQAKLRFYQNNYLENHPYYSLEPKSQQIKNVSLQQLMNFYYKKYVPEKTVIILVGDIDIKEPKRLLGSLFSYEARADQITTHQALENGVQYQLKKNNGKLRIDIIDRKGAQQVNILYGSVTVPGTSIDKTGLDMIAALLGGGPGSRLFSDLREKKGLTYSISARQLAGRYPSPFFIQTSVNHEKVVATINGIKNHINYLCHNKPDEKELEQIKRQLRGELLFKYQTNQQWIESKIQQLEVGYEDMYIIKRIDQINAMTADKLLALAKTYLCKQHQFIIVGQKEKLTEILYRQFNE